MTMPPRVRKLVLTAHLTTSLGWLGAVLAYIALDVTATTSTDVPMVRAAYPAMGVIVQFVIVPLALAALLTGTIQALGTTWGLIRHYWVLVSLLLTLVATLVLLAETRTVSDLAQMAASGPDPRELPGTLAHSIGGLAVLLTITILNIYKPRGLTRYGWRKQQQQRRKQHDKRVEMTTAQPIR
jgi:hypothetical protein